VKQARAWELFRLKPTAMLSRRLRPQSAWAACRGFAAGNAPDYDPDFLGVPRNHAEVCGGAVAPPLVGFARGAATARSLAAPCSYWPSALCRHTCLRLMDDSLTTSSRWAPSAQSPTVQLALHCLWVSWLDISVSVPYAPVACSICLGTIATAPCRHWRCGLRSSGWGFGRCYCRFQGCCSAAGLPCESSCSISPGESVGRNVA
jgi:hypothetical protein